MTTTHPDGDDRTAFDALSPNAMIRVNHWCDRYEQCWREGSPSLPEFVATIDDVHSKSLLPILCLELIGIDIQHRQLRALECSVDYYLLQFPHLQKRELTRVFNEVASGVDAKASGPLQPGQQLGDYVIQERIGAGGMGTVYRAKHRLMGRVVAIKVLSGRSATDRVLQRRFLREVRSFARLSHPNIISAFDARIDAELMFLVTEWVQGEDLAIKVSRVGPLPIDNSLDYARQAAVGLHYAHEQGIIHRDVKPSNLLLDTQGTIKVLDLGMSRWLVDAEDTSEESLTKSMHLLGTAAYMAPEQARSPLLSNQQSDIYSLGCTLYLLLTGTPPYVGANVVDVLFSHARDPIPDVRRLRGEVNAGTADLIQSMLAKDPSQRPASMAEVARRLASVLADSAVLAIAQPAKEIETPLPKTWSFTAPTIGAVLLVAIVFCVALLNRPNARGLFTAIGLKAVRDFDPSVGITMNGRSSYGQIEGFDLPLSNSVLMEASITLHRISGPANLVIWTGDRICGLFIDQSGRWGVSLADGLDSFVEIGTEQATLGKQQVISARYNGRMVELFIDGRLAQTTRKAYEMISDDTAIYFGGLPRGALPLDYGTRFLAGKLHRIRISTGNLPPPAASTADLLEIPESTLALIQFSETAGSYALDESSHAWHVQLVDMPAPLETP